MIVLKSPSWAGSAARIVRADERAASIAVHVVRGLLIRGVFNRMRGMSSWNCARQESNLIPENYEFTALPLSFTHVIPESLVLEISILETANVQTTNCKVLPSWLPVLHPSTRQLAPDES